MVKSVVSILGSFSQGTSIKGNFTFYAYSNIGIAVFKKTKTLQLSERYNHIRVLDISRNWNLHLAGPRQSSEKNRMTQYPAGNPQPVDGINNK